MMRLKYLVVLVCLATIGWAAAAHAQIKMEIVGPGSRLSGIAVPPLKNLSGDDDHTVAAQFVNTLSRNLKLSGYFRVIDPHAYVEDSQNSGFQLGKFNFADWSSINADFLVKGGVSAEGGKISVEALLFDVAQQRQLTGKRFSGDQARVPQMARRFADAILQATTGVQGPFDSKIAFVSTRGGRFKEVYTASVDGESLFRISNNPTINLFPSFDHSVHSLLYTSYKSGAPALYLVELASQRETRITSGEGQVIGGALVPDGSGIVAAIERNGATNLYMLDTSGSPIRRLTEGGSINVSPSISSDGGKLAFTSDRAGRPQIYLMSMAGGEPRRVTYQGDYNASPAISPNGDKIAYQSRHNGVFDIYVIDLNGGEPRQLTDGRGSSQDPSWSPDGRYLVFSSTRDGPSLLYLMQVDSGKIVATLTEGGNDSSPAWSWWLGE